MNKFFLAAIFLFFNSFCFSQIKAVTETGDEVILFEDGTWKYADTTKTEKEEININPKKDLASWASEKKDVLVIAGSYSRSGLFSSLTDSFIDPILEMQQLPVFITHH